MSSSELSPRRFLARLFASAAAGAALLLLGTWAIDPLGQLPGGGLICREGIKAENAARALIAAVRQPEQVFLGSSRIAVGIAGDDARALAGPRAANLGLHGGRLEEIEPLALNAIETAPVKRLWIGLDFAMFLPTERPPRAYSLPWSALGPEAAAWRYGLFDLEAVQAAATTLLKPGRCLIPEADAEGFALRAPIPAQTPDEDARRFDARSLMLGLRSRAALRGVDLEADYRARLARLAALVQTAKRRGIETVLLAPPVHPLYAEAVGAAGLSPLYARWRRDLRVAARGARLIDMSGPFPVEADCAGRSSTRCPFADIVHFRPAVGRIVLEAASRARRLTHETPARPHGRWNPSREDPRLKAAAR